MKKNLIIATCLSCLFIACQEYEPFTKSDMYTRQFEQYIGGEIHPEQTWGFGSVYPASLPSTRSSLLPDLDDPFEDFGNTDALYIHKVDDIPPTAIEATDLKGNEWLYANDPEYAHLQIILRSNEDMPNLWWGYHDFILVGSYELKPQGLDAARIYIPKESDIFLNGNYINAMEIYVAEGASLELGEAYNEIHAVTTQKNGQDIHTAKIFNRGTLTLPKNFRLNDDALLYNEGDIHVPNIDSGPGENNTSFFYNFGNVYVEEGDFILKSCSYFYNEGRCHVRNGNTTFTHPDEWWVNKGHFCTNDFNFSAAHGDAYNYCQLMVRGKFTFMDGIFNLMTNSYVEADHAEFSNFEVRMYSHSGININNGAEFGLQGEGRQGFVGRENSYLRIGGLSDVPSHMYSFQIRGYITYGLENLQVDDSNEAEHPEFIAAETTTRLPFEDLDALTSENDADCFVDWTPDTKTDEVTVRVIVEDLPATISSLIVRESDFDYNDAVFDVTFREEEIEITVHACGGTLPLYVADREVHGLFHIPTTTPMINKNDAEQEPQTFTIARNGITDANDIPVWVEYEGERYDITAFRGDAPAKICVGTDYVWCDEGWDIKKEYPNFTEWAKSNNYTDNSWYRDDE